MFKQDLKQFFTSKTNLSALVGIAYGIYQIKVGMIDAGVGNIQLAISALFLKDAVVGLK